MNNKICTQCEVELKCSKTGIIIVEMATYGPLAIWRGDAYACPSCKREVVASIAAQPEIYNRGTDANLAAFQARLDSYDLDKTVRIIRCWLSPKEKKEWQDLQPKIARNFDMSDPTYG